MKMIDCFVAAWAAQNHWRQSQFASRWCGSGSSSFFLLVSSYFSFPW